MDVASPRPRRIPGLGPSTAAENRGVDSPADGENARELVRHARCHGGGMERTPTGLFARLFRRTKKTLSLRAHAAGATRAGRRPSNQDALLVRADLGVFAVADGMGGYEGGEIASHTAIDTLEALYEIHRSEPDCTWPVMAESDESLPVQRARLAIDLAHRAVRARRTGPLAQMGSTLVLVTLDEGRLVVAHAGDSRVYRARSGVLTQLTRDHSFVNDVEDLRPMSPEERERMEAQFGHVVSRAIGHGDVLRPTVAELDAAAGDRYLLCSDGVHGWLSEDELAARLLAPPATAAELLVEGAIEAGSNDNVTAVVISVTDG